MQLHARHIDTHIAHIAISPFAIRVKVLLRCRIAAPLTLYLIILLTGTNEQVVQFVCLRIVSRVSLSCGLVRLLGAHMLTHNVFTNTTCEEEKKPHGCSGVLVAVRMRLQASHRPIGPLFVFAAAANQAPEHTPEPHARPATLAGPQARYQLANSSPPPALAGCLGQTHRRRPLAAPNCTHSTDRGGGSTRGADKAGAAGQKPPSQGLGRKQGHGRRPGDPSAARAGQVTWHHRRSRQMGTRVCLNRQNSCL